jgi:hypothetical protein
MAMGGLIALIVVGFAMATLGVALLALGEVPFIAGKRIPALRSRLVGAVLAAFVPLALVARLACNYLFGPDAVDGQVVTWSLFGLCWFGVFVILFRVIVPKREPGKAARTVAESKSKNPFPAARLDVLEEIVEEPEPTVKKATTPKKTAGKKSAKPTTEDENPFDFS